MNRPTRYLLLLKAMFVVFLVCASLMLLDMTMGMRGGLDQFHALKISLPLVLFAALFAFGGLSAVRKIVASHLEIKKLLAHSRKITAEIATGDVFERRYFKDAVVIESGEMIAFCFGYLHPRICLSTGVIEQLAADELRAAILHEAQHCRGRDPLRLLFLQVISDTLFFLPVVRECAKNYETALELRADRFAAEHAGKSALAGAMHRFGSLAAAQAGLGANALISGFNINAVRVAELVGEAMPGSQISALGLLLSSLSISLICALFV